MAGYNKTIHIGNLVADPQLSYTNKQMAVCNFRIACGERFKDKHTGDYKEHTEFINIVVWGKLGESCNQYLSKGDKVHIDGKIQTRSWDDDNGNKKYATEIVANHVEFLTNKKAS